MASVEDFFSNIPIIGGFFESDEEKNLKKQYSQMQAKYQAYRPVAQGARMNALQNVLDPRMLGPIQAQMAKMYGPGAAPNPTSLLRNPLGAAQLSEGNRLLAEKNKADALKRQQAEAFFSAMNPQKAFAGVTGQPGSFGGPPLRGR